MVSAEFDGVHFEEGLLCVYGDLACVIWCVFGQVGIPHIVMWESLLRRAFWVCIRADGGNSVKPRFLYY